VLKSSIILIMLLSLAFITSSCGSEYEITFDRQAELDKLNKVAAQAKKTEQTKGISDVLKRDTSYVYSAVGKRDPFRSYFGDFQAIEKERKIVSELQKYDITELKITAILSGIAEPRAVIITPNKQSHIVKSGAFIGKNWGKISRILESKIEVTETYKDPLGRKILNKLYLELPVKSLMREREESESPFGQTEAFVPEKDEENKDNEKDKDKD